MKKNGIILTLFLISILAGCFAPSSAPVSVMEDVDIDSVGGGRPVVGLYRLRTLDPLMITLLGIPSEKQLDEVIDEQGNITLPYIGEPVPAAGLTTSELEREIERIYTEGEIYKNITINILTAAKTYYMEGEIKRAQEYSLDRRITLLQAIAAASGYTEYANKTKITITRNGRVTRFNAKEIEKYPELDVPVEAGDRIKVHRLWY